jgi:hypothetical protein
LNKLLETISYEEDDRFENVQVATVVGTWHGVSPNRWLLLALLLLTRISQVKSMAPCKELEPEMSEREACGWWYGKRLD